ncbi:WYL domain-containing protein [Bacillus sp. S14(2024)]|uniref:WYL domain-containing protein n=1 Tax=Bacillus sp. S14(2024) TaxID=3162884 RepID=UPI003D21E3A4
MQKSLFHFKAFRLFLSNGLWYTPAFCYKRKSNVPFRVDRIISLKVQQDFPEPIPVDMTVTQWLKQTDFLSKELTLPVKLTKKVQNPFSSPYRRMDSIYS